VSDQITSVGFDVAFALAAVGPTPAISDTARLADAAARSAGRMRRRAHR
jgi:hypothetical protein